MTRYFPHILRGLSLFVAVFLMASCKKDGPFVPPIDEPVPAPFVASPPILPPIPFDYSSQNPYGITDEGATLGRVLFYDKVLSLDYTMACASCHKQAFSFSDSSRVSRGYKGKQMTRNTPVLLNLDPAHDFFWDLRENHLEEMVLRPILNSDEMGIPTLDTIVQRLQNVGYYAPLFQQTYGTPDITPDRIGQALNQFVLSIRSNSSRFDLELKANYAELNPDLSAAEKKGQIAFGDRGRCFACHGGKDVHEFKYYDPFAGKYVINISANIGLDLVYSDPGMGAFDPSNNGRFKVPTLRNIALTGPYMHDGRFKTLSEVIEHYSDGVYPHPNLDSRLKRFNEPFHAKFTEEEKEGLLAFLNMLTDRSITDDVRFSNPFNR